MANETVLSQSVHADRYGVHHLRQIGRGSEHIQQCSDDGVNWQDGHLTETAKSARKRHEAQMDEQRRANGAGAQVREPVRQQPAHQIISTPNRFPWWQLAIASAFGSAVPIAAHLLHLGGF